MHGGKIICFNVRVQSVFVFVSAALLKATKSVFSGLNLDDITDTLLMGREWVGFGELNKEYGDYKEYEIYALNSMTLGRTRPLQHLHLVLNSVNVTRVPASCPGSFLPSWAWGTPAMTEWCRSSQGRSSPCWPASGRAAARSPWCAWWGAEGGQASVQWRCPMAWLSERVRRW